MRLSQEQQWDRTVALYCNGWGSSSDTVKLLAKIAKPHALALPGDVLLMPWLNGQAERQMVIGVTSKGRSIGAGGPHESTGLYLGYGRWRQLPGDKDQFVDYGPMRIVRLPGELAALPLVHPDLRGFVLGNLRAGPHGR